MRQVQPWKLGIGHAGEARDMVRLRALGISALVDLAMEEAPATISREMVYCRFPLVDGGGNQAWLVRSAIEGVVGLVRSGAATLVCCSAGMSRSPSIAAAAVAVVSGQSLDECLRLVVGNGPADISPAMWSQVIEAHARISLPDRVKSAMRADARPEPRPPRP